MQKHLCNKVVDGLNKSMYNSFQQFILSESAMRNEILKMFNATSMWQDRPPERQKRIMDFIKEFRDVTQNKQALHWLVRIIYRALVAYSDDENSVKKAKRLQDQGYRISRITDDLNFFLHPTQHGQFLSVWKSIQDEIKTRTDLVQVNNRMVPASQVLQQALNDITFASAEAKDLPCSEVYNQLNSIKSMVQDSKQLPAGKIVHEYADASTWNLLDKGTCDVEGRMMKHCGNVSAKPGDRILSYREKQNIMMKPRLTFILNNGKLGEMKGFANAKPAAEYHERIVDLLQNQWVQITHLQGHGYMPQNNFSLNDLNEALFKQLAQHQPELVKSQLTASDHVQQLDDQHKKWLQQVLNS